jgi:hypothetical protein
MMDKQMDKEEKERIKKEAKKLWNEVCSIEDRIVELSEEGKCKKLLPSPFSVNKKLKNFVLINLLF